MPLTRSLLRSLLCVITGALLLSACGGGDDPAPAAPAGPLEAATVTVVREQANARIHTLLTPGDMLANTSHIIELASQLIVVDGQFFAQYGQELKAYTDRLRKPVTRFYISHDHPDHYLGFGDAFPDVPVYALQETRDSIAASGDAVLAARQAALGPLIATRLNKPSVVVEPGTETIDGVTFVFERWVDNEAPVSLVIKLPQQRTLIAQDIVYNRAHLFISGPTTGWRAALNRLRGEAANYDLLLPGHGEPGGFAMIDDDLAYLDRVDALRATAATASEYKAQLLAAYPSYSAADLIDIYLPILYP